MSIRLSLCAIVVLIAGVLAAPLAAQPEPVQCRGIRFLWTHVYNPQRLEVRKLCAAVTGVVVKSLGESDGDLHIRLKLDSQFTSLLNDGNRTHQGGNLVVEPICDHNVIQPDAIASCATFHSRIPHFRAGTYVVVVGSYVLDHEHGWMEIHPVVRITETQ